MTEQEIKDWAERTLGSPTFDVEITADQLTDCLEDTLHWYALYNGQTKTAELQVSGNGEYDVASDCSVVTQVIFPGTSDANPLDSFDWAGVKIGLPSIATGNYSDFVMIMQRLETIQQVIGSTAMWIYDRVRHKLVLDNASGSQVRYYYLSSDIDVELLHNHELYFVKGYMKACVMTIVGEIRRKYSDVPSAEGAITLDGSDLSAEASELMNRLTEEIKARNVPLPFLMG